MDPITHAVREMYEQFPYPAASSAELRANFDVRLLLGHGLETPPAGRRLHALDAGCGKAIGLLGAASVQPDVQFVGIDLNRVALTQATAEAKRLGQTNVRFQEVDLMTLEGLEVPPGGFDVIYSSGVVHHLASPVEGLRGLARVLAPHGVIDLLVYGRRGREPVYRLAEAVDLLIGRDRPLPERLAVLRALVLPGVAEAADVGPFRDLARTAEVELVDRYLNVNETSYDVPGLLALLQQAACASCAGASPSIGRSRRCSHRDRCSSGPWRCPRLPSSSSSTACASGTVSSSSSPIPATDRARHLRWRNSIAPCCASTRRSPCTSKRVTCTRGCASRHSPISCEHSLAFRFRPARFLPRFCSCAIPFTGEWLRSGLERSGLSKGQAEQAILELLAREILYRPDGEPNP